MYVYIEPEPGLWTVGFYSPDGTWNQESDWGNREGAAARVNYLNGNLNAARLRKIANQTVVNQTMLNQVMSLFEPYKE